MLIQCYNIGMHDDKAANMHIISYTNSLPRLIAVLIQCYNIGMHDDKAANMHIISYTNSFPSLPLIPYTCESCQYNQSSPCNKLQKNKASPYYDRNRIKNID